MIESPGKRLFETLVDNFPETPWLEWSRIPVSGREAYEKAAKDYLQGMYCRND